MRDMTSQADPVVPSPAGLVLAPLRALRFDTAVAGPLASLLTPPYDVIDADGVTRYEAVSPYNVVRLILPRGPESGAHSRYAAAAQLLGEWRAAGVLRPDAEAALYVYELRDGEHMQRGLLGAVALCDPDAGIVLPHENTMAGPVSDRLALTEATQANTEPIFLVYDGGGAASAAVADPGGTPIAESTTDDGVEHRLWAITAASVLADIAADLLPRRAVIADGHHRYANFRQHQADRHAAGDGPGPWDFGLAFLVDATAFGPQVHPIHRVIPGLAPQDAADRAADAWTVQPVDGGAEGARAGLAAAGKAGPAFAIGGPDGWWVLTEPAPLLLEGALPRHHSAAWRALDVTVAHLGLIHGTWGLTDDETTVWYRHDATAAEQAAGESGGTALLLNPTPAEAVIAVAAAGERMPRKSTFFTPKPATGMVLRTFADA